MKPRRFIAQAALATALSAFAGLASAGAITPGSWVGFCFGDAGSPATSGCQNEASQVSGNDFTFTLSSSGLLKVTDAFNYGDTFKVYDGGTLLGASLVSLTSGSGSGNPNTAFADSGFSHFTYQLGAGSHAISIFADASPYGGGGAYMGVFPVPEPETYAMLLAGLGLMGGIARRRRHQS